MIRLLPIALCILATACGMGPSTTHFQICQTDQDCSTDEVCFPLQGCGNPGGGLVVEVQGNTRTGELAQDFAVGDGGFSPILSFNLVPATLTGEFVRDEAFYSSPVTVSLRGESELIPGLVRSYQAVFNKPERGTYSLPVGAGNFVVTAEASDPAIPPARTKGDDGGSKLNVTLGSHASVSFVFPSAAQTIVVTGRLLKRIDPGPIPEIPLGEPMDVQAFDAVTLRPLSQRIPVTGTGDFSIFVAPEATALGSFSITATPRIPGSLVPSKSFTIKLPLEPLIRLELGEFGDPLPQMQGDLKTTAGIPIAGATVYLEGPVNGGGTFRSKLATTDSSGVFRVDLLPSAFNSAYVLTALPPPTSDARVVQRSVQVIAKLGSPAILKVSGTEGSTVVCPDKITVVGSLLRPGGSSPAIGTRVVARAVEQLKELAGQPLPMGDSEAITDESGRFSLELDPGVFHLDFLPGEDLPRTSLVVTVGRPSTTVDGGMPSEAITLKPFELRKGRRVTGTVTVAGTTGVTRFAVNATVRYFRVSSVAGNPTSLLLGETITDTVGNYAVILPAK